MRGRASSVLFALLSLTSCKDDPQPESADGGQVQRTLSAPEPLGVEVSLPVGWAVDPVVQSPSAVPKGDDVRIVGKAHRVPGDRPFLLVPPKVVLTVEETARVNPREVFESTLDDIEQLDQRPNVRVRRSALSTRFVGREQVGEIEVSYAVRAGDAPPQEIVHRSSVLLRRPEGRSRVIVTVTATYLQEDAEIVGAEVQAIMNSLRITN